MGSRPLNRKKRLDEEGLARNRAEKRDEQMRMQLMAQAERARFVAERQGELPMVYISVGISNIDPLTNMSFTWDLWVKLPFKVLKSSKKMDTFKERIQIAFQEIFLA